MLAVMVDDADQAGDPLPDPTFGPNAVRAAWALQPGDEDGDAVPTTGLPRYPVIIFWSDEDGCWIADVPDLPGISALGNSPEDAMAALGPAIEQSLELRHPLPNPSPGAAIVAAIRAIRSTGCTG